MNEYCIRFIPLPTTLKGITVEDSSGFYNIYINDSLSYEEQQKAIRHELSHVTGNDFNVQKPLYMVEPYRPAQEQQPQKPVAIVAEPPKKAITFSIVAALTGKAEKIKVEKRQYPCIDIWADELDRPPLIFRSLQK